MSIALGDFMECGESGGLVSRCCRESDWSDPLLEQSMIDLRLSGNPMKHRKFWEWAFISRVLQERGMLERGRRGLGFAVGEEPLPAFFASRQVDVLASDLRADAPEASSWLATGQNAGGNREKLYKPNICSRGLFDAHVRYRDINMNELPAEETGYDFCWSSCAIEHVGSLERSKCFMQNVMKILKPGGYSVHTTEFNLTSNDSTIETGESVIWRRRDVEELQAWMTAQGHNMEVSFARGNMEGDLFVDTPPFYVVNPRYHICLQLGEFASTSFAFIIRKGGV